MSRSINKHDTDWKREWEDEQTLTPEEQQEADALQREEEAINAQIMADLEDVCREDWEEYRRAEEEELYRRGMIDDEEYGGQFRHEEEEYLRRRDDHWHAYEREPYTE